MKDNELQNFDDGSARIDQVRINNKASIHINTYFKIVNSMCKIKCENNIGTGFLFKTKKGKKDFYCLVTCEHVITKDMIEKKKTISIENSYKAFTFILDKTERFIRDYTYMNIDATLIEIFPEILDVPKNFFLSPEPKIMNGYDKYNKVEAYIAHFPLDSELKINDGNIIGINKYSFQFTHSIDTQSGSSGGPIFEKDSIYILGIHKQGSEVKKKNYASFIYPIVDSLNNNNDYYEMKYYDSEDSIYEGEIKNNLREGYGKLIYKNGCYYKGQWKNDKRQGFGVEYSLNDKILYQGEFFNNEYNGYGRIQLNNEHFYIGTFFKGKKQGKGEIYDKNNKLKYKGNFANDVKEGEGIIYLDDGKYYKGNFSNDMRHGKGTAFDKNGNILYEGEYAFDIMNGYGRILYKNGYYYKGFIKNGEEEGEGSIFYNNGKVYLKGNFSEGKLNEEGKEYYIDGRLKYEGNFIKY
jgi:hypothetical protein